MSDVTTTADPVKRARALSKIQMDWEQVIMNGGPPCFAQLEDERGWYCGRAQHWEGHDGEHQYVSVQDLLTALADECERLREQWNTRIDGLCGNCGQRYRGPRDEKQHGLEICGAART